MGTIRRITDLQLASIGSTKVLSVTSSEVLYQISSGMRALEITNQSTAGLVYYGQSNLAVNSGIWLNTGGQAKFFDTVSDTFQFYIRASSGGVGVPIIIQEYRGND